MIDEAWLPTQICKSSEGDFIWTYKSHDEVVAKPVTFGDTPKIADAKRFKYSIHAVQRNTALVTSQTSEDSDKSSWGQNSPERFYCV